MLIPEEAPELNDLEAAKYIQQQLEEMNINLDIDTILTILSLEFEYMLSIGIAYPVDQEEGAKE